jgi:threo-3-hydroxy-D-aspartate ammonia-lyase
MAPDATRSKSVVNPSVRVMTPALLLDLDVLERNIAAMSARAKSLGVALRPHIKTHKCIEIGRLQREHGAKGITVSTLYEARVFADHGFDDITWAFPVIVNRIPEAAELAERVTLRLVVDSTEAVDALERSGRPFHVWLKVDCGYHRAGVAPQGPLLIDLARRLNQSRHLTFDGILSHSGHAYKARTRAELVQVAEEERRVMAECAGRLAGAGCRVSGVSVGSTPAMSAYQTLQGVTEVRPGNYVFYDHTMTVLGVCGVRDCAVTVLSSVVSSQPDAGHCVVDAGALALSKDVGPAHSPQPTMGEIFSDYSAGSLRMDARLASVSQEHGVVSTSLPVGTEVRILPNHSCLTVAQFDEFVVMRGETVVDRWRIWRGRDGA